MKKHNTIKVVLITLFVFMLLTWILPAAYYSSGYVDQGRIQMGLFDLFNYPVTALSYFGYIALFVVVIGGFYGVLHKIPAYRTLLDKMVAKFRGKEKLVISVIMILLAVLTSICGLQIGLIIFFPFLVSLILLMGYDKMVAALTLVGSTMIGIAGTTFAYSNTNIVLSVLSVDITSELLTKVIILLLGVILLIVNTFMYIKKMEASKKAEKKEAKKVETKTEKVKTTKTTKTSKNSKKDSKAAVKEEEVIVVKEEKQKDTDSEFVPESVGSKKHKVWPFVLIFSVIFIILVLAFIPWANSFSNAAFTNATKAVTEFELFGFPIFGKILGTVNAFGTWSITDMIVVMFVAVLVLSLIYKVKLNDVFDGFAKGAKKALAPALIVILIYTCLVIVTYHPFQLVIYKAILGITKGFNVFTSAFVAVLASAFNVDPSYTFQSVLPYLTSVVTNSSNYPIVAVVFQSIYGLTMLVAPTSLVLMGVLSYLGISYGKWLKNIWKLLLEFLVILLIIFTILILL